MKILAVICAFILTGVKLQESDLQVSHLKARLGKSDLRIIGGAEVQPHAYPFQAALLTTSKQNEMSLCGGTLIDPRWILTAAHCVDYNPKHIDIILGAHNLSSSENTVQIFRSKSYYKHADYDEELLVNDIALVRLPKNATLNSYVNLVPVSRGTNEYSGENGVILGWGTTDDGSISETLKSVSVEVMSNEACKKENPIYDIIIESHVCVSGRGPKGSCGGDSGGPLLVNGTQIGLVSFGPDYCTLGLPSVFTRLNKYNAWIVENMNSNSGISKIRNVLRFFLVIFAFFFTIVNIFN